MARPVKAEIVVQGRAVEVEQLWYDKTRWPSWIDGFGHIVSLDDDWPQTGAKLLWDAGAELDGGGWSSASRATSRDSATRSTGRTPPSRV